MTEEARALLIVAALLSGAAGSAGFVGGRMSAPVPPPEVRIVHVSVPVAPEAPEAAPTETPAAAPAAEKIEPPAASVAPVEVRPPPLPRPKIDAKPQPKPRPQKLRPSAPKKTLPSCAVIKREYDRMTFSERMAEYRRATPEQVAHGKRCLGF